MAIGLAGAVLVMGTLTQVRVVNASIDDASAILGMTRLRAGLPRPRSQPGALLRHLGPRRPAGADGHLPDGLAADHAEPVAASTSIFLTVVNAIVAGMLGALVTAPPGLPALWSSPRPVRPLFVSVQILIGQHPSPPCRSSASRPRAEPARRRPLRRDEHVCRPRGRIRAARAALVACLRPPRRPHAHGFHVLRRHAVLLLRLTPARTSPALL